MIVNPDLGLNLKPAMKTIVRELPADLDTPVSVYMKLAGARPSFLLESVTGGEQVARYSFIGVDPEKAYAIGGNGLVEFTFNDQHGYLSQQIGNGSDDAWHALRGVFNPRVTAQDHQLPRFRGGLVGYMGYELTRFFEPATGLNSHQLLPDAIFLLADILIAFDHAYGRLLLIGNFYEDERSGPTYEQVEKSLDEIEERLRIPLQDMRDIFKPVESIPQRANMSQQAFHKAVMTAKEHIAAGDIFQVVLSQSFEKRTAVDPFNVYRTLRRVNPSPYMFFFNFGTLASEEPLFLIGASPEMHARLEGKVAAVRPIAGTRRRGNTPQEEVALEVELLADPKERAEHVMLVDLARNDLGRICKYGSVKLRERMIVEKYSHVMHIVSHVEGELREEYDAFDLLQATFPAGTVSGAPKIRAMQIINGLEPDQRGPYAGAVGYFSYDGSMDTCITIRTLMKYGDVIRMQAGAGIVADSVPETEYQETLNKLGALAAAIELAERDMEPKKEVT